jgi:hypothetical protein
MKGEDTEVNISKARLGIFMAVKIHVMVFWVTTLYSDVVGYQHFRWACCFHFTFKMETEWPSEIMVSYHMSLSRRP